MPVGPPAGDDCLDVRGGHLFIEGCDTVELARRFGTPLYVISEAQLRGNARMLTAAFERHWPDGPVAILPSLKANLSLALRWILTAEGLGCDCFGGGELEAALACGVPPERISLNGAAGDEQALERAVAAGVRLTLESAAEVDIVRAAAGRLGRRAAVRLRVRPWLEGVEVPSDFAEEEIPIALMTQLYKAGMPTEELPACAQAALAAPELDLVGVMAHMGRHSTDLAVWTAYASAVAGLVLGLGGALEGWLPRELDLGGGFAVPRDPTGRAFARRRDAPLPPPIEDYAAALAGTFRRALAAGGMDTAGITLQVEPGRAIYANAGIHLAAVRSVKRQREPLPHTWVQTDTSEVFLADALIEHNRWSALAASRAAEPPRRSADITGLSCGWDVIVPDAELPDVEPGDVVAFLDTGAYQDATASNFNALPRPATVLVNGAEADLVKRRETAAEVCARDVVPARLRPEA